MNFSISAPLSNLDTLVLGLYYKDRHAAACGSYIDATGNVTRGAVEWCGAGLASALAIVLEDAKIIGAQHLLVFCNHAQFVSDYSHPIRLKLPDQGEKVYVKPPFAKKLEWGYQFVPTGNINQWNLIRSLCYYRRWKIVFSEILPKSQKLFEERINQWQLCSTTKVV